MKRLSLIIVCLLTFMMVNTSCFTAMTIASIDKQNRVLGKDFGKEEARMVLTTFQKISDYAALATTGKGDVVCVLANFENRYYDGLKLSGHFVNKGTYSYVTVRGIEKHVLIYAYKNDLERLEAKIEQFLQEKPEIIVDSGPYV